MKGTPRTALTVVVAALALMLAAGTGATASLLITGKQVKDGSLTSADVKNKSLGVKDLSTAAQTTLKGRTGATGATGAAGERGAAGPSGAAGTKGDKGETGLPGLLGPEGLVGPPGLAGPQGLQGLQGLVGPQGLQGLQGLVGPQGLPGVQGLQGIQGIPGLSGFNVVTVTKNIPALSGLVGGSGSVSAACETGQKAISATASYAAAPLDQLNSLLSQVTRTADGAFSASGLNLSLVQRTLTLDVVCATVAS